MPAKEIYVSLCIGSVSIPTVHTTCEGDVRKLIELFWKFRVSCCVSVIRPHLTYYV